MPGRENSNGGRTDAKEQQARTAETLPVKAERRPTKRPNPLPKRPWGWRDWKIKNFRFHFFPEWLT